MPDHYCPDCGQADYDCRCNEGKCSTCGDELLPEELEAGRDQCFDCYLAEQD
jgi:hypothetical protein